MNGTVPQEVWRHERLMNKFSPSVLLNGDLYGIHGNTGGKGEGVLRCVEFLTGRTRWEHDLGRLSSLLVAGGRLVILTEAARLIVAQAAPDGYHELARGQIPTPPVDPGKTTRGKWWTAPVLCRGLIFCRNDLGDLVCVDVR